MNLFSGAVVTRRCGTKSCFDHHWGGGSAGRRVRSAGTCTALCVQARGRRRIINGMQGRLDPIQHAHHRGFGGHEVGSLRVVVRCASCVVSLWFRYNYEGVMVQM